MDSDLDTLHTAFHNQLRRIREVRRAHMAKPTTEQASVENLFPVVTQWVRDGHIEVGDQKGFGFVDAGAGLRRAGLEDDRPITLAAFERGLHAWYEEQGIGVG